MGKKSHEYAFVFIAVSPKSYSHRLEDIKLVYITSLYVYSNIITSKLFEKLQIFSQSLVIEWLPSNWIKFVLCHPEHDVNNKKSI